ncbi:MAG: class I SAM-dependent methyltransferase [Betaproteobacteria bacterium]|nr:class I SAM-dependent methyltransferase [Betaproteobacteria bacterium]
MNTTTLDKRTGMATLPVHAPAAAHAVFRLLPRLQHGTLDVQLPDGSQLHFGGPAQASPLRAALRLHNWNVCSAALKSGDIGFAESFIDGDWTTPDLTALLKLFIANRDDIEHVIYGSWWGSLLYRAKHLLNRNSRSGSRKNIHAHYDLGNAFYRLWLDETMTYSAALFEADREHEDLAHAQRAKVRRALRECGVQPGSRVLEIGCGWGGLAEIAAAEFSAQVTGVTLSTEQLAWAQERLARAGVQAQCDLRLQDYRDIRDEPFDAIASIEMFEAVGEDYWPGFFKTVHDRLKRGGVACIQSITIRDDLFDRYRRSTDFIQQYIFPGGMLPSKSVFREQARKAGLQVSHELAFGADYAETLKRWREVFLREEAAVRGVGFDTRTVKALANLPGLFLVTHAALQVAPRHVQAQGVGIHMLQSARHGDVPAALVQGRHQFHLVVVVFGQRGIGVVADGAGGHVLNGIGWLLEEERRLTRGVRAHFAGVRRVVASDAVDAAHRVLQVGACHGNGDGGHGKGHRRRRACTARCAAHLDIHVGTGPQGGGSEGTGGAQQGSAIDHVQRLQKNRTPVERQATPSSSRACTHGRTQRCIKPRLRAMASSRPRAKPRLTMAVPP